MKSKFDEVRETEERHARIASQADALQRWLQEKHPDIQYSEAVKIAFVEYMGDSFLTATPDDFEYALETMPTTISRQRVPTEAETKTELIQKIISALQSTNNQFWHDSFNVQSEKTKMSFWSVEELIARLDEVKRAQNLNAKPTSELKQILVAARQYRGFPTLGKTIVRPGTVRAVPLDAAYLQGLDSWELRKFCRLYGTEQINDRLAGKN